MKRYYRAGIDLHSLENCCGILEAGAFSLFEASEEMLKRYSSYGSYKHTTPEEAWKAALEETLNDYQIKDDEWGNTRDTSYNCPIQFWFVKKPINDQFDANILRELVIAHEGQVYLGTFRNPNTGNIIEGYMIKHNVEEINE